MIRALATRGQESQDIDLAYGDLDPGETYALDGSDEAVAVVLTGQVAARAGDVDLGSAGGRSDPFSQAGHAVYAPPGAPLELTGGPEGAVVAVVSAAPGDDPPGAARVIGPDDYTTAT